jgi:uncharacterized protein YndB with AHSA1/START domain
VHASRNEHALPPIEIDTLVPCGTHAAFDYFTRDIARWWPLAQYSCSEERAAGVSFDGGKLVETDRDGKQYVWGTVLAWEPGRCLVMTWHPGTPPEIATTITVTFDAAGTSTRVRLVHSGWERLGDKATDARGSYAGGWPTVLGRLYQGYCEGAMQ